MQQTHISHALSKVYVKQSVVSCVAAADVVLDVLQLVVGLFQFMEASSPYGAGAQQREPAFGFSTPAHEMVSPFWDVAECRELGDVEPCSLSHSDRLSVSK